MTRGRWLRILVALTLLVVANAAVEWEIARRLESRYRGSLAEGAGLRGDFADISVCLPCLSYTLRELRLESRDAPADRPILYAGAVDVGADTESLLRGRWRGRIALREAQLRVAVGGEDDADAFAVPWSELGEGLFPAPIARIEMTGGRTVLRHDGFAEPVEWAFRVDAGQASRLAPGEGPPRVVVDGGTPGRGRFELTLEVGEPQEGGEPSRLRGTLRGVALEHLGDYLRQRMGVDVDGGELSARIALEEDDTGWHGSVDCEVVELEVFELRDLVEQGPLQTTRDGFAGVVNAMRRSPDGVLRVRVDIHEPAGADAEDRWQAAARILRWLALAPFTAPLQLLEAAATS